MPRIVPGGWEGREARWNERYKSSTGCLYTVFGAIEPRLPEDVCMHLRGRRAHAPPNKPKIFFLFFQLILPVRGRDCRVRIKRLGDVMRRGLVAVVLIEPALCARCVAWMARDWYMKFPGTLFRALEELLPAFPPGCCVVLTAVPLGRLV